MVRIFYLPQSDTLEQFQQVAAMLKKQAGLS